MIKENIYDEFACLADKCQMTCCKGWAIKVEQDKVDEWQAKEETQYLSDCIVERKEEAEEEKSYNMKTDACTACVLLDEKGLCNIVKKHGSEALSKTCAEFPRKHNRITIEAEKEEDTCITDEYSLSGACPAVIELLEQHRNEPSVVIPQTSDNHDFPIEYQIRNMIIELLGKEHIPMLDKIMLCFSFLHECLECEWDEDIYNCMEVYRDEENLEETIALYQNASFDSVEAFVELCQTFYDVTEYYKKEEAYRPYLEDIANLIEQLNVEDEMLGDMPLTEVLAKWQDFCIAFSQQDSLSANVMIAEIFADCISEDLEYFIESFQSIIMEYVMTRVSMFANTLLGKEVEIAQYFALYIRMIGHNIDGMAEYWEENFEDPILDKDYLFLLLR